MRVLITASLILLFAAANADNHADTELGLSLMRRRFPFGIAKATQWVIPSIFVGVLRRQFAMNWVWIR